MLFVNRPWGYGSVGRAMRSQRIGHEFESRYLHQKKNAINLRSFFCENTFDYDSNQKVGVRKTLAL